MKLSSETSASKGFVRENIAAISISPAIRSGIHRASITATSISPFPRRCNTDAALRASFFRGGVRRSPPHGAAAFPQSGPSAAGFARARFTDPSDASMNCRAGCASISAAHARAR